MNKQHPNISVLQKFDPTNIAGAADILADGAVFHYFNPQLPDLEGDYVGLKGFQAFFGELGKLTRGTFKANPISAQAMGDELVVVHVKDTMVLEDRQMELDAVVVWRIVNGKITEAWDLPAVNTVKVSDPIAKA